MNFDDYPVIDIGLQNPKMLHVSEFYDMPLLFICQDTTKKIYLVMASDEDNESQSWLFVHISKNRMEALKNGKIDLYTAFKSPEYLHKVKKTTFFRNPKKEKITQSVIPQSLSEDELPDRGEKYVNNFS